MCATSEVFSNATVHHYLLLNIGAAVQRFSITFGGMCCMCVSFIWELMHWSRVKILFHSSTVNQLKCGETAYHSELTTCNTHFFVAGRLSV